MRGTDSLRDYLRLSSLPCMINSPHAPAMPPPGHKSHLNHLAIIPTHYRCLVQVRQFRIDASELGDWLEQNVPNRALGVDDIDPETCHRLALPCPSKPAYDIPPTVMLKPESLEKVGAWIENLPLTTAARAFALMHPDKPGWEFTSVPGGKDGDIFRSFFWTLRDNPRRTFTPQEHIEIAKQSVVVAYQPPWILSDQDMFEFCSSQDYPSYDQQYSEPFTSKARLWGKIWDTCVTSQCYYFVLTSYNKWAFGKFSEGYKDAYVTEAFDFNMQGPSIAELLLAWLIAPTDDDLKTRIVPESLVQYNPQATVAVAPEDPAARYATPCISESNWSGKDDEIETSAGLSRENTPTRLVSPHGISGILPLPFELGPVIHNPNLTDWAQQVAQVAVDRGSRTPTPAPCDPCWYDLPSPTPPPASYVTRTGIKVARDRQMPVNQGFWMDKR